MLTNRLNRYAWATLAFNIGVVLFGAVVRATGSGAGCGSDWPTCRGGLVPTSGTTETAIEFTHRTTSGIALIMVAILVFAVLRSRPKGDVVRVAAIAAGVMILSEALLGAMLVLFEWVEEDQSNGRAVSIALHLINTFLLLGTLALTAWWSGDGERPKRPFPPQEKRWFTLAAVGLILVGAAGAITALGDTLFPAESIFEGIRDDFTGTFLVRLRWIHPILAVVTGLFVLWLVPRTVGEGRSRRLGVAITWLVGLQLVAGAVNVGLLAPVWMQVVHLLLADVLWVLGVLYATEVLGARRRAVEEIAA